MSKIHSNQDNNTSASSIDTPPHVEEGSFHCESGESALDADHSTAKLQTNPGILASNSGAQTQPQQQPTTSSNMLLLQAYQV